MEYRPLLWVALFAVMVPVMLLMVQRLLAPRHPTPQKGTPFECGAPVLGSAHQRMPIKFYLTAVLFLLFDIEVVFLFPWAVVFGKLGAMGFWQMMIFLGILEIGLLYVWRKGALEWE